MPPGERERVDEVGACTLKHEGILMPHEFEGGWTTERGCEDSGPC